MRSVVGDSCLIKVQPGGWAMASARVMVTLTPPENGRAKVLEREQDISRGEAARRAILECAGIRTEVTSPCTHEEELEHLRDRVRVLTVERAEWHDRALTLANRQAHQEGQPLLRPQAHHKGQPPSRPQAHPLELHSGSPLAHRSRVQLQANTGDAVHNHSKDARTIRVRRRDGTSYLAEVVG
jgi:hypothetical protein